MKNGAMDRVAALAGAVALTLASQAAAARPAATVYDSRTEAAQALGYASDKLVFATPAGWEDGVALYQFVRHGEYTAAYARVRVAARAEAVSVVFLQGREVRVPNEGVLEESPAEAPTAWCVPSGSWDDTLSQNSCCSFTAVSGSTKCFNAADYGTTWASCIHVCGTALVGGCVPSGGIDDTLSLTRCCSGAAVGGSTHCLDPRDYGTTWKSCVQTCQ